MNLYAHSEYKGFLRAQVAETRGTLSQIAKSIGCGQSYLSQVLNGKPELTPDQGLAVADFFRMSQEETEYFCLLVQHGRATTSRLRNYLSEKIEVVRANKNSVAGAIAATNDDTISIEQRDFYYSSWVVPALHTLTAIPAYGDPEKLARHLAKPIAEVNRILEWLIKNGLVHRKGGRFIHSGRNLHLPTPSLHNKLNHMNFRLKAIESSNEPKSIHYTSVFAISSKDWSKLKSKLTRFLEEQRADITKSGSDEAIAFCCDLFKI